jgi:o-succinylbenzoate synthase
MSDPEVGKAWLYRYRLPLRRPLPVFGAEWTGPRLGWIVVLSDAESKFFGYGDAAPLIADSEVLASVEDELMKLVMQQVESSPSTTSTLQRSIVSIAAPFPSVEFAISSAVSEYKARVRNLPLHRHLFSEPSETVYVNALVHGSADEDELESLISEGYACFKVKVGSGVVTTDAEMVCRLIEVLRGRARVRLDANRSWTMSEACRFADETRDVDFEYIEEPLSEPGRLEELFYRTGWPIALDESIVAMTGDERATVGADDFRDVAAALLSQVNGFIAAVVIKPSLLGSIDRTFALVDAAAEAGIEVVISSSFESGFGLRTLCALAANPLCCQNSAGLFTHKWFADDVCRPPILFGSTLHVDEILNVVPHVAMANTELVGQWQS